MLFCKNLITFFFYYIKKKKKKNFFGLKSCIQYTCRPSRVKKFFFPEKTSLAGIKPDTLGERYRQQSIAATFSLT